MANIKTKLPSISRIINDREKVAIVIASFLMLIGLAIVGLDVWKNYQGSKLTSEKRQVLVKDKTKWEEILQKHPDYRDGFLALAVIEFRLGNKERSEDYLNKSLEIDPNYEDAKKFEDYLKNH